MTQVQTKYFTCSMKLSIIIPAFNEELYLKNCLNSVFAELKDSNKEVEVIVVNNASTDSTREIALTFPKVILVDEKEKGLTKARKAGYLISTGDLIANVDADNVLPTGWIEKVFAEFAKHKKLVGLSGPYVFYDMSKFDNLQVRLFYYLGYIAYLFNHFIFRKGGMLQGGNFVVKRTALEEIGGYDTNILFYGEDADIARRLQKTGYMKFTFGLPMLSSGRRLTNEGILIAGYKYAANYFSILFFKKPYAKNASHAEYINFR